MADMAEISQVEASWEAIERLGLAADTIPLTYMNSTAAIKPSAASARARLHSSNARAAFEWLTLAASRGPQRQVLVVGCKRILFLPDQHLGRNTGYAMGIPTEEMVVWTLGASDWPKPGARRRKSSPPAASLVEGHCAVHQRFLPAMWITCAPSIRHSGDRAPECRWEVSRRLTLWVPLSDSSRLLKRPRRGNVRRRHGDSPRKPHGSLFAEQGKRVITLDDTGCLCTPCTASARTTCLGA